MKRSSRMLWFVGGLLLLATAGVCWVFLEAERAKDLADPARARKHGQPIPVRTAVVTILEPEAFIGATAVTLPSEQAIILIGTLSRKPTEPLPDLIIKARYVHEGDCVKRGQLLFELEDKLFRDIAREREIELVALKTDMVRVQQQIPVNLRTREHEVASAEEEAVFRKQETTDRKQELDIMQTLYKSSAAGAVEWLNARVQYNQALYALSENGRRQDRAKYLLAFGTYQDQADLARVTAAYEKGRIDLQVAQEQVRMCQIKSFVDGYVSKVDVIPGQPVDSNTKLAIVSKLDPIDVQMDFPQERIDEIAVGQKAEVVLDSFPRETFKGTVQRILPQVNTKLRVLPVIVRLTNPKDRLKPGISGFVRVGQARKALGVPSQALLKHGSKAMVFRVENGRARIQEVQTGPARPNGLVEVRQGLGPGDEVILFHNFYLHADSLTRTNGYVQDNDLVDTDWRKWTRRN